MIKNKEYKSRKEYFKNWFIKNKPIIYEKRRLFRMKNRDKINQKNREWYKKHKEILKIWRKRYYFLNNDKRKQYDKNYMLKLRLKCLSMISNGKIECSNCGCKDIRILQINHINGGGSKEYAKFKQPKRFYKAIIRNERNIDDLNILCWVCNQAYYVKKKFNINFNINQA